MIAIDYAVACGQGWEGQAEGEAGVGATISTGMIGQGVGALRQKIGDRPSEIRSAWFHGRTTTRRYAPDYGTAMLNHRIDYDRLVSAVYSNIRKNDRMFSAPWKC